MKKFILSCAFLGIVFGPVIFMVRCSGPDLSMPAAPNLPKTSQFLIIEGFAASDIIHILLLDYDSSQVRLSLGRPDSSFIFFDYFSVDSMFIAVRYHSYKKDSIESIRITTDRFKTKAAQIGYWATRQEIFDKYGCKAPIDNGVEITYPQFGVGFDFDEDPQGQLHASGVRLLSINRADPHRLSHRITNLSLNDTFSIDQDHDGKYQQFEFDWSVIMPDDSGYITTSIDEWNQDSSRWVLLGEDNSFYKVRGSKPVQLYFTNGNFTVAGQRKYRININTVAGFTAIDTTVAINVEPAIQDSASAALPKSTARFCGSLCLGATARDLIVNIP